MSSNDAPPPHSSSRANEEMKSQAYINASVTEKQTYPTAFAAQVEKEALKAAKVYYDLFFETQSVLPSPGTQPPSESAHHTLMAMRGPGEQKNNSGDPLNSNNNDDDDEQDEFVRRRSSMMVPLIPTTDRLVSPLAPGSASASGGSSITNTQHRPPPPAHHSVYHNSNTHNHHSTAHYYQSTNTNTNTNTNNNGQQEDAMSNTSFPSMSSLTASVHHVPPRNRVVNTPFHTFFPPVLKWSDRRRIIQTIVGGPSRPFREWQWRKSADFEEILRGHDAFLKTVADREEGALPAIGSPAGTSGDDTNNNNNNNNNNSNNNTSMGVGVGRRVSTGGATSLQTLLRPQPQPPSSSSSTAAGGGRRAGPLLVPREPSESPATSAGGTTITTVGMEGGSFQSHGSTTPGHPPPLSPPQQTISISSVKNTMSTSPLLKPVPPSTSTSVSSTPRGMQSTGSSPARGVRSGTHYLHHANSALLPGESTSPCLPSTTTQQKQQPSHSRRPLHLLPHRGALPSTRGGQPTVLERAASAASAAEPALAESAPAFTTTIHRTSEPPSPTMRRERSVQNASSLPLPGSRAGGGYDDINNSFCYSFPASHQGPEYFTIASEESIATRVIIVMVGLPARGKTFLAQKICRLLGWHGERGTVYNVQAAWRQAVVKASAEARRGGEYAGAPASPSSKGWVRAEHFQQLLTNPKSVERKKYNEVLDEFAVSCREFFEDRGKVVILNDDFVTHELRMEAERRFRHIGSHYFYIEMIRGSERNSLYNELKVQDATEYPTQIERDTAREDFKKRLKILEELYESLDEIHEHQYLKRTNSNLMTTALPPAPLSTAGGGVAAASPKKTSSHSGGTTSTPPILPTRGSAGKDSLPNPMRSFGGVNNNSNNSNNNNNATGTNSLSASLTVSPPLGARAPGGGGGGGGGWGGEFSSASDAVDREAQSYIMIRDSNTIEVHGVEGYLCSRIVSYLMNISQRKIQHPIYFVRHGESCYNLEDRIGGNPLLTAQGMRDSAALLEFLDSLKLQLHLEEKHRSSSSSDSHHEQQHRHHRGVTAAGAIQPDNNDGGKQPSCSCAAAARGGCCADGDDGETSQAGRLEIWTSQLQRAIQTAELSERLLNIKTLRWSSLNEIHAGVCEELTYAEVRERYQLIDHFRKEIKYTFRYPGGESYQDMVMRLEPVIMELENAEKVVVVVAHQAILRCLLAYFGSVSAESSIRVKVPHRVVWRCTYDSKGVAHLDEIHLDNVEAGKFASEKITFDEAAAAAAPEKAA